MNKILIDELWPNNGHIMIEFSDYELNLGENNHIEYSTFKNFVIINTVHEDDLEWGEEYVSTKLIICDKKEQFNNYNLKQNNKTKIIDQKFDLKNSNRIAITSEWDATLTDDYGYFIELEKLYSKILLKVFINNSKTEVFVLGLLLLN